MNVGKDCTNDFFNIAETSVYISLKFSACKLSVIIKTIPNLINGVPTGMTLDIFEDKNDTPLEFLAEKESYSIFSILF